MRTTLRPSAAVALAQGSPDTITRTRPTIYLPWIEASRVTPIRCGRVTLRLPDAVLPSVPPPDQRWQVLCGGFGAIRDIVRYVVPEPDARRRAFTLLAVGDGAVTLDLDLTPDEGGRAVADAQWIAASHGENLTGLNALYAWPDGTLETAEQPIVMWAAGDRARIAAGRALDVSGSPRWTRYRQAGRPFERARTQLHSLMQLDPDVESPRDRGEGSTPVEISGWAVGETETANGAEAFMLQLNLEDAEPVWRRRTWDVNPLDGPAMPPLHDVQAITEFTSVFRTAWVVGYRQGLPYFGQLLPAGARWQGFDIHGWQGRSLTEPGRPRELLLRSETEGWAFGDRGLADADAPQAAVWSLQAGAGPRPSWSEKRTDLFDGQSVVDAYQARAEDGAFLALAPSSRGDAVVLRRDPEDLDWRPVALWNAAPPTRSAGRDHEAGEAPFPEAPTGHHAFAPLDDSWSLLALGDAVWLLNAPGGNNPDMPPTVGNSPPPVALLERKNLRAIAPRGADEAWAIEGPAAALGAAQPPGHLVNVRDGRLWQTMSTGPLWVVALDVANGLEPTTTWALDPEGGLWRSPGSSVLPWSRVASPALSPGRLTALDATDGTVFAAGHDGMGGAVWRFDGAGWHPVARLAPEAVANADGPLVRIAVARAGDGYHGLAAGADYWVEFADRARGDCPWSFPGDPADGWLETRCEGACCVGWSAGQTVVDVAALPPRNGTVLGPAWLARGKDILHRPEGDRAWTVQERVRLDAPQICAQPCEVPDRIVSLEIADERNAWAVWQDLSLGADRAASHVVRRTGPWFQGADTLWTHETTWNVPIHDTGLLRDSAGAEGRNGGADELDASTELWLAGDWTTIVRRRPDGGSR